VKKSQIHPTARPLFDTFKKRGDAAAFARDIGISDQTLANWKIRGVPPEWIRPVALKRGLPGADAYHSLIQGEQKANNHQRSDGEMLLAMVKAFLETDSEGKSAIAEAVEELTGDYGTGKTTTSRKGAKRG
jgi:hypothetical protein